VRRIFISLLILLSTYLEISAQSQKIIYFDRDWKVTNKINAEFYRVISFDEDGNQPGKIRDYYISGAIQWEGRFLSKNFECSDAETCQFEGICTFYYLNGRKNSEGYYSNGKLVGAETNWDEKGNIIDLKKELSQAMKGILVKEQFSQMSTPENITKQMITQAKHNSWVITDKYIYLLIEDSQPDNSPFNIITYKYQAEKGSYIFICTDKNNVEYNVEYKKTSPKRIIFTKADGTYYFIGHN
jgi:hypothetical protein